MSRRVAGLLIGGVVLLAALVVLWVWLSGGTDPLGTDGPEGGEPTRAETFELYFPGPAGNLVGEVRELEVGEEVRGRVRVLVEALLAGPESDELFAPFPEEVDLVGVYQVADGVVFVDLGVLRPPAAAAEGPDGAGEGSDESEGEGAEGAEESEPVEGDGEEGEEGEDDTPPAPPVLALDLDAQPPSGGSLQEMLMIYSVVDTLCLNLPEVRRVVLLWNGQQRESFSGHIDTSRPLGPREDLISRSGG